jgi:hypothetical protein
LYLLEGTEENHKIPQDNQHPGQDVNQGPPEYSLDLYCQVNLSTVVLCILGEVYCHSGGYCCLLQLGFSLILNMDTPHSYETLAKFCQIPQCHIAKYITF